MTEINFLSSIKKIKRHLSYRNLKNIETINISKKFEREYFDGDRKYGYGGYVNDGRWKKVAEKFINYYKLEKGSKILDIGCAKGFLVHEFNKLGMDSYGIDISQYAMKCSDDKIKKKLSICNAKKIHFQDNFFDLVVSFNTIHNLPLDSCFKAILEINRIAKKHRFIQVDAYSNHQEKKIFLKWVLTAETHGTPKFWLDLFKKANYDGDWYWTKV